MENKILIKLYARNYSLGSSILNLNLRNLTGF